MEKPSFVLSRIRNSQHGILPYYTRVQEIQFSVRCKAKVIKEIELPVSFTANREQSEGWAKSFLEGVFIQQYSPGSPIVLL